MPSENDADPWADDLLEFAELGKSYTNLVKSISDSKVVSIEAGFGRGKTFFREAWATELRNAGEKVIEIDAQQSDHSGDPVITFLAALMESLEATEKSKWAKTLSTGAAITWKTAKLAASVVGRKAGEEAFDELAQWLSSDGEYNTLDELITDFGNEASKALGAQLAAQMAAERVRKEDMPTQLKAFRQALTKSTSSERVVILIDELDRCHPDYAITLLEAMKLVFYQDGFVFILFVNADHLEQIAGHRFGKPNAGERYLDKFIDIRLQLPTNEPSVEKAVSSLCRQLPLGIPFGDRDDFSIETAAVLAGKLAKYCGFSMRQLKKILLKIEVALRCYRDVPIDAPLLVLLAFEHAMQIKLDPKRWLPRAALTPEFVSDLKIKDKTTTTRSNPSNLQIKMTQFAQKNCVELATLPDDRYGLPDDGRNRCDWGKLLILGDHYILSHKDMLNAAHKIAAVKSDDHSL